MKNKLIISISATSVLFFACDDKNNNPVTEYDFSSILTNVSEKVITATYEDLHEKAETLLDAINELESNQTAEYHEAAKEAWRVCRSPWEQSEGFLFGPVSTAGIDPSIDSWPVNTVDLDAVLASADALTKDYIDGLEGTLKGFHTIEYLIWGTDGNKTVDDFTEREFEYLIAVTQSIEGAIDILFESWSPAHENFAANISNAGEAGSIYVSQKSAMQEIVNGMIAIADEVANGKINDPLSEGDITLEESRFSANSKSDFQDNIRSIENLFDGKYLTDEAGVSDFILSVDAELEQEVHDAIHNAIDAIGNIPGTFTDAIFINPDEVSAAQTAVRDLQTLLETEVKPIIDEL
ncbi:MAG: imelysin [Fimbriimonadaceae bacterium]|nr:imelysin [Chitinophagales bacterium]